MDVKAAATRKIGPLPAWGWGVAIGGALLAFRFLRGGGSGGGGGGNGAEPDTILVPSGAPSIPHDYIGQLGQAVGEIRDRLGGIEKSIEDGAGSINPVTPPPPKSPPQSGGNPVQQPTPSSPGAPVSAKPKTTILSRADAAALTRKLGYDPAKVFGYGTKAPASSFWVNNDAARYVWNSPATFEAWLRRTTRDPAVAAKLK